MGNASKFVWVSTERWQSLRRRRVSQARKEAEHAIRSKLRADLRWELDQASPVPEYEPIPLVSDFEPWLRRRVDEWSWGLLTEPEAAADGLVVYTRRDAAMILLRAERVARTWAGRRRWTESEWSDLFVGPSVSTGYLSVGFTLSPQQRAAIEQQAAGFEWDFGPLSLDLVQPIEEALAELGTAAMLARLRLKSASRASSGDNQSTEDLDALISGLASAGGSAWAPEVYGGVREWIHDRLRFVSASGEFKVIWREVDGILRPEARAQSLLAFLWMEVVRVWNLEPRRRLCSECPTWFEHPNRRVKLCEGCRSPAAKMKRQRAERRRLREIESKRSKGERS